MSQPLLFAHISWMPEYSGKPGESIFSTHGYVIENEIGHERWNYKPEGDCIRGYVPIRGKAKKNAPGEIAIEKLGASKSDDLVEGITIVWFANHPDNPKNAYIIGWYRNATVFREAQFRRQREFRMQCAVEDATLLASSARTFAIPHVRSIRGRELGYGYGQSSLWYAENAPKSFLRTVREFLASIDKLTPRFGIASVEAIPDAIDDLDGNVGNESPKRRSGRTTYIVRDPEVRRKVIQRANGHCEFCGAEGFEREDGSRFVEAHHIIHLALQGPDTLDNVIALCPNHHREAHFGKNRKNFEEKLKSALTKIREIN